MNSLKKNEIVFIRETNGLMAQLVANIKDRNTQFCVCPMSKHCACKEQKVVVLGPDFP